jgi:hypothetical protein
MVGGSLAAVRFRDVAEGSMVPAEQRVGKVAVGAQARPAAAELSALLAVHRADFAAVVALEKIERAEPESAELAQAA